MAEPLTLEPPTRFFAEGVFADAERTAYIVDVLKAIAHPVRLRLVAILSEGPQTVSGLAELLGLNQAVISQQLRILRMCALVDVTRTGGFAVYRLIQPHLSELLRCMVSCAAKR